MAEPTEHPIRVQNFLNTLYHLIGAQDLKQKLDYMRGQARPDTIVRQNLDRDEDELFARETGLLRKLHVDA